MMDPNATLNECRTAASRVIDALDHEQQPDPEDVQMLGEAFQALDEWLTKGGFRPNAWGFSR